MIYLIFSRSAGGDRHGSVSEAESEEENEEGDYTVYECPGLAPVSEKFPVIQLDRNYNQFIIIITDFVQ